MNELTYLQQQRQSQMKLLRKHQNEEEVSWWVVGERGVISTSEQWKEFLL